MLRPRPRFLLQSSGGDLEVGLPGLGADGATDHFVLKISRGRDFLGKRSTGFTEIEQGRQKRGHKSPVLLRSGLRTTPISRAGPAPDGLTFCRRSSEGPNSQSSWQKARYDRTNFIPLGSGKTTTDIPQLITMPLGTALSILQGTNTGQGEPQFELALGNCRPDTVRAMTPSPHLRAPCTHNYTYTTQGPMMSRRDNVVRGGRPVPLGLYANVVGMLPLDYMPPVGRVPLMVTEGRERGSLWWIASVMGAFLSSGISSCMDPPH